MAVLCLPVRLGDLLAGARRAALWTHKFKGGSGILLSLLQVVRFALLEHA